MPALREAIRTAVSLLAPQQNACHLCGALLHFGENTLCQPCRQALAGCRVQGFEAVSADCAPLSLAVTAYWYEDLAQTLVHQLKFGHDRAAALPLADGLCVAYTEHGLSRPDGVLAVPAHSSRLRARGYNQAELLARAFCVQTGLLFLSEGLVRLHHSPSQTGRGRRERLNAMAGAFEARRSFAGMRLLLIDDVFTTGATAMACAAVLTQAGAARVELLACCLA